MTEAEGGPQSSELREAERVRAAAYADLDAFLLRSGYHTDMSFLLSPLYQVLTDYARALQIQSQIDAIEAEPSLGDVVEVREIQREFQTIVDSHETLPGYLSARQSLDRYVGAIQFSELDVSIQMQGQYSADQESLYHRQSTNRLAIQLTRRVDLIGNGRRLPTEPPPRPRGPRRQEPPATP